MYVVFITHISINKAQCEDNHFTAVTPRSVIISN